MNFSILTALTSHPVLGFQYYLFGILEFLLHIIWEAVSLKSKCQHFHNSSEDSRGKSFLSFCSFFWDLTIFGVPCLIAALFQSLPVLSCHMSFSLCVSESMYPYPFFL